MAGAFSSAFSSAFDVGATASALLAILDSHGAVLMRQIKKGATDQSVVIRIVDSGDGTPETAVEHNTAGIDLWYRREGATKTSITEAALTALNDAHSDGGIEHIGDGYYRLDLPDAAFASGANGVMIGGTVTGMVVIGCYVHLTDYDPQDTVRLGLTALPNAAADAAGGLPISDAGGLDLDAQIGTKINDILTDTGTTLQGELDGIQADTEDIQGRLPAALVSGRMDSNMQAAANDVITAAVIAAGAIDAATFAADVDAEILSYLVDDATRIDASALNTAAGTTIPAIEADTNQLQVLTVIRQNTAQTGSAGSITLDASASASNDFYLHSFIRIVSGTGADQNWRVINAYVGSTKVASVVPNWTTAPDATSVFVIAGSAESHVRQVEASAITATSIATGAIDADAIASDAVTEIQNGLATAAALATVDGIVDDILVDTAEIGAAGAGLTEAGGTGDHLTALPWNAAWDAEVQSEVSDELTSRGITSAFFSGITSLAQWLGIIAGKQLGNSTARTEIRATGAGSGTYDEATDSLEANRDNIGSAGAGLTEAGGTGDQFTAVPWNAAWDAEVESEVTDALNTYDPPTKTELDTAVDALPTAAENAAALLAAGDVDGYSLEETLKLCLAALAGKLSGAATATVVIRAADDSKARITATVDADGQRTAVTLDATG